MIYPRLLRVRISKSPCLILSSQTDEQSLRISRFNLHWSSKIITARKQRLGQGNVFTPAYDSVIRGRGLTDRDPRWTESSGQRPLGKRPPLDRDHPGQGPPRQRPHGERAIRILLECILVTISFCSIYFSKVKRAQYPNGWDVMWFSLTFAMKTQNASLVRILGNYIVFRHFLLKCPKQKSCTVITLCINSLWDYFGHTLSNFHISKILQERNFKMGVNMRMNKDSPRSWQFHFSFCSSKNQR